MATNREIFNNIAKSWYGFRHHTRFQTELTELAVRWQKGRLLNVGCGHGPDFLPFINNFELYGIDFSVGMIEMARRYSMKFKFEADLVVADARYLPYKDKVFDYAIAVATYHHLQSNEERRQALTELRRVIKDGGEVFITVWNRWQPRFWLKGKDVYVPWKTGNSTYDRYYYLFSGTELKKLIGEAGFEVIKVFPEVNRGLVGRLFSRNICILARAG